MHKDSIFLCILSTDGTISEKVYGVLTPELHEMRDFMKSQHVTEVAMESTSIYWIPVWNVLCESFTLKLVNPYFIKQLPGRKSDVKDAQWIAECVLKDLIRGSFVPGKRIQELRQYDRRIIDLDEEIVRKLAKMDNVLQRCNIRLSNYLSNTNSKSYKDVVEAIVKGTTDPEELVRKVHGRITNKHGRDKVKASLTGTFSQADKDMLSQYYEEIKLAQSHKEACIGKMNEICEREFKTELEILLTIPGVKQRSATAIIAEMGTDMKVFPSANHAVSWIGLSPRNDESNKKIKSRRITHGNKYLRKTLIQCSWGAMGTKGSFFNSFAQHQVMVRRKAKMKVVVAVARKIVVCVWHMLDSKSNYCDFKDCVFPT